MAGLVPYIFQYISMKRCVVSCETATISKVGLNPLSRLKRPERAACCGGERQILGSRGSFKRSGMVICETCLRDSWLVRTWSQSTSLAMSSHNECIGAYTLSYSFKLMIQPVSLNLSESIIWYLQESDVVTQLAGYQLKNKQQKKLMNTRIWKGQHKPKALEKRLHK